MAAMVCTVTSVDQDARTCDCEPINEDAPLLGCNLQAGQGSTFGVVQIPRVGSYVVVGFLADGAAGVVLLCDDVERVELVVKDVETGSVVVSEAGVVMNGGGLDGLVKINELTAKLNGLVDEVNAFVKAFNSHTHTGVHGPTSAPLSAAPEAAKFDKSDYENEKVKQ